VSVYNADGYYQTNSLNAYSLNSVTAKKVDDGSVSIQFGGCDGNIANCLPIMPGWNYMVRPIVRAPKSSSGAGRSRSRSR
jgi:hypothetical protein